MTPWQRILLRSAGAGAGAILATGLLLSAAVWYSGRPKHPAPWNANAIRATYDGVRTGPTLDDKGGTKQELWFYYVVTNTTDLDYKFDQADQLTLMGKLETERSLLNADYLTIDRPVFIPSKQSVRLKVHMPSNDFKEAEPDYHSPEHKQYHDKLLQHINSNFDDLDGFVLYDNTNRYQINFPGGWKKRK
jgi:hypothetical protein